MYDVKGRYMEDTPIFPPALPTLPLPVPSDEREQTKLV